MNPAHSRYPFAEGLAEEILEESAEAAQLERSSPVLFVLVLAYARERKLTRAYLKKLLVLRRREILFRLKLPSEEWVVRQIGKISIHQISEGGVKLLRKCLRSRVFLEQLKLFDELPFLFAEALFKHGPFFTSLLARREIDAVGKDPERQNKILARLFEWLLVSREVEAFGKKLGISGVELKLQNLVSGEKLVELRDEWKKLSEEENPFLQARKNRAQALRRTAEIPFPEPVLPGKGGIRAIRNPDELLEEGQEMRHCVGTYASRIYKRECDIYGASFDGERATLEVKLRRGRPVLGEVKSFQNRPVSSALRRRVEEWFLESSGLLSEK